jgi:hypothetical protein
MVEDDTLEFVVGTNGSSRKVSINSSGTLKENGEIVAELGWSGTYVSLGLYALYKVNGDLVFSKSIEGGTATVDSYKFE